MEFGRVFQDIGKNRRTPGTVESQNTELGRAAQDSLDLGPEGSPESRDHLGEAHHLLDAVADQVGQVWEHGELRELQVHGGALVLLLRQRQAGERRRLRRICAGGKALSGPGGLRAPTGGEKKTQIGVELRRLCPHHLHRVGLGFIWDPVLGMWGEQGRPSWRG